MRMITGAILIVAAAVILSAYMIVSLQYDLNNRTLGMRWFEMAIGGAILAVLGLGVLCWGFVHELKNGRKDKE